MDVKAIISVVILALVALGVTIWLGQTATTVKPVNDEGFSSYTDDKGAPPLDEDDQRPKAVVDETSYEFGAMEIGEKRHHTFTIRNEGEDTLVISKGASTCKCTVSDLPNNEIPPGETAEVNLEWEPKAVSESFAQGARIWTNDPDHRAIDFRVEGQVTSIVQLIPGLEVDAGNVLEETGANTRLLIVSELAKEMSEPEIVYAGERLTFTAEKASEEELKEHNATLGYQINVHVAPTVPVGAHRDLFEVNYKVNDKELHHEISVRCIRKGPVTVIPTPGTVYLDSIKLVDFGRFAAAKGKKQAVTVMIDDPPNGEEVELTAGEIENPNLKINIEPNTQLALNKRHAFNVTLEIPPGLSPLDYARKSTLKVPLKTNHPSVEEILLRVELHSY